MKKGALAALWLVACGPSFAAGAVDTRRSIPPRAFAAGLPHASDRASPGGIVGLRPSLEVRIPIPGGTFRRGSTDEELKQVGALCEREPLGMLCHSPHFSELFGFEQPSHQVRLSSYFLDRTEVTVGAYQRCVSAGVCPVPAWSSPDPRFDRPELPVTFVDWDAASTYCHWTGGRLPTDAEWEFAARGPEERRFPWGDVYNPYLANHGSMATDRLDATDGFLVLAPVGSFPDGATPLGLLDMAGNVSEWVSDYFEPSPTGEGYEGTDAGVLVNPKGPKTGSFHIVRGGDYTDGAPLMRTTARTPGLSPLSPTLGFRCAADGRSP